MNYIITNINTDFYSFMVLLLFHFQYFGHRNIVFGNLWIVMEDYSSNSFVIRPNYQEKWVIIFVLSPPPIFINLLLCGCDSSLFNQKLWLLTLATIGFDLQQYSKSFTMFWNRTLEIKHMILTSPYSGHKRFPIKSN